jgi:type I restriction enzyme S subunit
MTLDTFFDKFDLFAEAPDAVGKMRELILRLAMQGKLVSQNPRDKSAEVLVVELKAEASDKNGRRTAPLPPIVPDEIPFELPAGWVWERLGNIGETNIGLTYSPQDVSDVGTPVLRSSNVQKGKLDFDDLVRVTCEPKQSVMVQDGDLLICARNGSRALVGKVALIENLNEPAAFGAFMAIFRSRINTFLYHFICSPLFRRMIDEVNTTTINQITQNNLRSTLAPIPPLAEQKRIVAKVDELMALCDRLEAQQKKREQQHAALSRAALARFADAPTPVSLPFLFHPSYAIPPADLRKSILTLAVQGKLVPQDPNDEPAEVLLERNDARRRETALGDHRADEENQPLLSGDDRWDISDTWSWRGLADLVLFVDYRGKTPEKLSSGVRLLTAKNVRKGQINLAPEEFLSENEYDSWMTRGFPKTGDILFTTEAPMGNAAVVDLSERFALAQRVICFQSYGALDPAFLVLHILSDQFQFILDKNGTGVTAKGIKASKLKQLPIAVPPLAEQLRIVAKVEQLMALVDELERQLAASRDTAAKLLSALVFELTNSKESHAAIAV